jgi:hypothetical protein
LSFDSDIPRSVDEVFGKKNPPALKIYFTDDRPAIILLSSAANQGAGRESRHW